MTTKYTITFEIEISDDIDPSTVLEEAQTAAVDCAEALNHDRGNEDDVVDSVCVSEAPTANAPAKVALVNPRADVTCTCGYTTRVALDQHATAILCMGCGDDIVLPEFEAVAS